MKRFVTKLLSLGILFTVLYAVIVCVAAELFPKTMRHCVAFQTEDRDFLRRRLAEADTTRNVDVLFVGSSLVYRGFDNRIFADAGYRTFSLGGGIQTPLQSKMLLKKYLENMNPRLVICEGLPLTLENSGVESATSHVSKAPLDLPLLKMIAEVNHPMAYHTLLFAAYREVFWGRRPVESASGKRMYVPGGYVQMERQAYIKNKYKRKAYRVRDKQVEAMRDIARMLADRDVPFVIVRAPITRAVYESRINNAYVDSLYKEMAPYYDFNASLNLEDEKHFLDGHHLNQQGVEIFNRAVVPIVEKHIINR